MSRRPLALSLAVLAIAAAIVGSVLVGAPGAEAHAILTQSDPPVNAQLSESPQLVSGFFSEPVDDRLSSLEVFNGSGDRVDNDDLTFGPEPERMSITLKDDLPPCFYTVVWETLSAVDGHLLKGSYPFTVLTPEGGQPDCPVFEAGGITGSSAQPDNVAVKWAGILAATALVGALAFVTWVHAGSASELPEPLRERSRQAVRRRAMWMAWPAVAGLVLVAAGEILLQVEQLGGFEWLDEILTNDWGERWIQRQIVLGAIVVALGASIVLWRADRRALADSALWSALAGGIGYLLLVATISHANSVPGSFWATASDFLHLVSSSVWVGMLGMLGLFVLWVRREVPEDQKDDLQAGHLQRFSTLAATSVVILLATGSVNGLTHISDFESLWDTAYGRSLLVKLGVMAALLVVAGINAFYLRARTIEESQAGQPATRFARYLSFAIWVEIALAVGVMFFAAVLIQYPTSRQLVDADANVHGADTEAVVGYDEIQPADDLQINLSISPNAVGQNSFRVTLFGPTVEEVIRVRLRFQPPDEDAAPSQIELESAGTNAYRAVGPFISTPGGWDVNVDIRRRELDDVSASFPVAVESHMERDKYGYPLTAGSWWTVGAVVILVASVIMAVWVSQWPRLPEIAPRFLRVGTAAFSVVGAGVLVLSFLPGEDSEAAGNPIEPTAESIAIGRSLYMANCAQCHGNQGMGDGPAAAELEVKPVDFREHLPYHRDEFFFQVMTSGLGEIMPAFGDRLTEDERWHILNFLKTEFGTESSPTPATSPGH